MQQTLHSHISHLKEVIGILDDRLADSQLTPAERVQLSAELRVAQLALVHYRQAYELEQHCA